MSSDAPAVAGETIVIFCTGLGETVSPQIQTGEVGNGQPTLQIPTITIGGESAQVVFSGAAPGFVALYQINVVMPSVSAASPEILINLAGQLSRAGVTVPNTTSSVLVPAFWLLELQATFDTGSRQVPCVINISVGLSSYFTMLNCTSLAAQYQVQMAFASMSVGSGTLDFSNLTSFNWFIDLQSGRMGTITDGTMHLVFSGFSAQSNFSGSLRFVIETGFAVEGNMSGTITSILIL